LTIRAQVLRLLALAIGAIFRPKALLIAENLCLSQQLAAPRGISTMNTIGINHHLPIVRAPINFAPSTQ
jgi:hypothetical protein